MNMEIVLWDGNAFLIKEVLSKLIRTSDMSRWLEAQPLRIFNCCSQNFSSEKLFFQAFDNVQPTGKSLLGAGRRDLSVNKQTTIVNT